MDDLYKGLMAYEEGDYENAFDLLLPFAEQGDTNVQLTLGEMYRKGWGNKKDAKEAVKWYRRAADQGYREAKYNLGRMYLEGNGVSKNLPQAFELIRQAARQDDPESQAFLGYMYAEGIGVSIDLIQAYIWADAGALNGVEYGVMLRKALTKIMTDEEISEAQKLAKEYKAKNYKDCG